MSVVEATAPRRPQLRVSGLRVEFAAREGGVFSRSRRVAVVDGVSFDIAPGECLGLVGESGSGKSTVGRAVLRLVPAAAGRVEFEGEDVLCAAPSRLRELRRRMQMVFQDPGSSLNPRMRVGAAVGEPLVAHGVARGVEALRRAEQMLERCGLSRDVVERYPHELSGGQRQRVAIARALMARPALLVCDEPTSALDVSVQAQVLNLLRGLRREFALACLFISHDMGVIDHMCDRVAVMRAGRVVECGPRAGVMSGPGEEYTRGLLEAAGVRLG